MYKFHADLNLSHLVGCELVQVSILPYNLVLQLEPGNLINIESQWRLFSPDGTLFDEGDQQQYKDAYRVHHLLQKKIVGYEVLDPTTFDLTFEENWHLHIIDDSDQYECVTISPDLIV